MNDKPNWLTFGPGKQLYDALAGVEYITDEQDPYGPKICPECQYKETDGHDRDCAVGRALHPEDY